MNCKLDHILNYPFCRDFNRQMFEKIGRIVEDIRMMTHQSEKCMLDTNETAMLELF